MTDNAVLFEAAKNTASLTGCELAPAKRQVLLDEAANWDEGGAFRPAVHAAIGGLTGRASGALGAGTVALSADAIGKLTDDGSIKPNSNSGSAIGTPMSDTGITSRANAQLNGTPSQRETGPTIFRELSNEGQGIARTVTGTDASGITVPKIK